MFPKIDLPDVDGMHRDLKELLLGIGDLLSVVVTKSENGYAPTLEETRAAAAWKKLTAKHR